MNILDLPKSLHVRVTNRDIIDGDARSCMGCALALAINRALPDGWECKVIPYACFVEADGIGFGGRWSRPTTWLPVHEFPDGLIEWAMEFDDWKECKRIGVKEWREAHSAEDDERPYRPAPWEFDLDLTKLENQ